MTDPARYFAAQAGAQGTDGGTWVAWNGIDAIEMVPGLRFQPVLGNRLMVNFVHFDPHTEAPLHWHEEEQISFVLEGELEFEVAGETRVLRRGQAVVIPPNVPHAARTHEGSCLEVDAFHPPRKGLLEAMGLAAAEAD
jgi:quercetin dioxygenase-like cupin family protein